MLRITVSHLTVKSCGILDKEDLPERAAGVPAEVGMLQIVLIEKGKKIKKIYF